MAPVEAQLLEIYQRAAARYQEITDGKLDAKFLQIVRGSKNQFLRELREKIASKRVGDRHL